MPYDYTFESQKRDWWHGACGCPVSPDGHYPRAFSPQSLPSAADIPESRHFQGEVTLHTVPGIYRLAEASTTGLTLYPQSGGAVLEIGMPDGEMDRFRLVNVHGHGGVEHAIARPGQSPEVRRIGQAPEGSMPEDGIEMHAVFQVVDAAGQVRRVRLLGGKSVDMGVALGRMLRLGGEDQPEHPAIAGFLEAAARFRKGGEVTTLAWDVGALMEALASEALRNISYYGSLTAPYGKVNVWHMVPADREADLLLPPSQFYRLKETLGDNVALVRPNTYDPRIPESREGRHDTIPWVSRLDVERHRKGYAYPWQPEAKRR